MEESKLLEMYRQMYLVRRFEEEAAKAYTERKIGGFLHLYIGQEAVASGSIAALQPQDVVYTAYRCHAHYLARGGTARGGMAELFGKQAGCAEGRGGSMHFYNVETNFLGGWGIVGAHSGLAIGAAFAQKYRGDGGVTLCYLGEGAVSIGPFHEAMCLAALWKLPIVFIIENNGYAMGTPAFRSLVTEDASIRALGYPMARATVEGVDVVDCYNSAKSAIDRARSESLPFLLEFKTYRYRGHSMADPGKYRSKEEVDAWKERDPLVLAERRLLAFSQNHAQTIQNIQNEVEAEVQDAVQFAHTTPDPVAADLTKYTYIEDAAPEGQLLFA